MTPEVDAFFDPATNTVTYLVADPGGRAAAVIDPVLDFDAEGRAGRRPPRPTRSWRRPRRAA